LVFDVSPKTKERGGHQYCKKRTNWGVYVVLEVPEVLGVLEIRSGELEVPQNAFLTTYYKLKASSFAGVSP
jgi:hypothetical protein